MLLNMSDIAFALRGTNLQLNGNGWLSNLKIKIKMSCQIMKSNLRIKTDAPKHPGGKLRVRSHLTFILVKCGSNIKYSENARHSEPDTCIGEVTSWANSGRNMLKYVKKVREMKEDL